MQDYTVFGNEEWVELPELKIPAIKARVDSGAKTSSIHAINIQKFKKGNELWVRYEVFPLTENRSVSINCESKIVDTRTIKSSIGISEKRYIIKTKAKIGDFIEEIEVSLANRETMGYKMLIGREAMQHDVLVNPNLSHNSSNLTDADVKNVYRKSIRKKSGLKIGVLASNPNLYSNKRLIEAGEERGHEMKFLNIQHCYMKLDTESPEIHYRGGIILNDIDAIIPRIRPSMTFYGCALIRQFDSISTYSLNSSESITHSRNKLYSTQLFSKNKINIPITGFAKSPLDTKDLISMVNGAPLIIKLLESTQGNGVVLAETNKAAESVINAFKSLNANILVQEFIKEANGRDIRCIVIDGKVVASMERVAQKGEFRANLHKGGQSRLIKVTPEERKLAIRAAKSFNLMVAGVDLIRSNKGPLLLEVNSSPGLEGIENATGKDVAKLMISVIEKKLSYTS